MKITELSGNNFCSIEHIHIDLADKGLVAIQGENLDDSAANSNGSGKSSLVDLICWIITGTTARGSSGESVIKRDCKSVSGVLNLVDGDKKWTIVRRRTKTKEELGFFCLYDSSSTNLTQGTNKLTQELIWKTFDCTEEVFRAAIYVGQENLIDLPRLTDKQLKELIEKSAGVEVLERAYELARESLTHHRVLLENENKLVSNLDNRIDYLKQTLDNLKCQFQIFKESKNAEYVRLNKEIDEKDNFISKLSFERDSIVPMDDLNDALKSVADKLKDNKNKEDKKKELIKELGEIQGLLSSDKNQYERVLADCKEQKDYLDNISDRVGQKCDECGSILTEEHLKDATASAKAKYKTLLENTSTCQRKVTLSQNTLQEAQKALKDFQASMPDVSDLVAQHAEISAQINKVNNLEDQIKTETSLMLGLKEQLYLKNKEENPFLDKVKEAAVKLILEKEKLVEKRASIEAIETQYKQYEQVVEIFSPNGVRAHMIDEITPYLNAQTSKYLTILTDGEITAIWNTLTKNAKGEYKERFSIDVTKTDGGSFNELSGGEKRKVRIACALALQDLVASRASKSFNFWIGDEIDTALDDAGLERLMVILNEKAKEKGTVFVISHQSLNDWVPNVWTMKKEDGKSVLIT